MDGKGEFRHRDGHVLGPHFKNNLFFIPEGSNCAINPFKCKKEIESFLERIRKFKDNIEEKEKFEAEKVNLYRVLDGPSLAATLTKVRANGRTPLIVSAFDHPQDTADV